MTAIKQNKQTVSCEGEIGSKHPLVYLHLAKEIPTICPYCSKKFVRK